MLSLEVDGRAVEVADEGRSLLEVLREDLGVRSAKDGCSPQGQCGCCTVLVDGAPRVACVTPVRRVAGRRITTLEGLAPTDRDRWTGAFCATGASQCGFCTPGIILRLEGLRRKRPEATEAEVERALGAHLCRCTGWRTILEAWAHDGPEPARDLDAASRRASLEGGTPQLVALEVAGGRGGFADDLAPQGALVAVPDGRGGWALGESPAEARAAAGRIQGRRSTAAHTHPLDLPPGEWARTLRTTWVEPAYLELDASWCEPGGEPATPLANGGAFGGKVTSPAPATARRLADEHGRPVRVLLSREDTVRLGPKRPPIAAAVSGDGAAAVRIVRTPGIAGAIRSALPGAQVEEVEVPGPPTSATIRAAGWAEAAVLAASVGEQPGRIQTPEGAVAEAAVEGGAISVSVRCGDPLDEVALRSYCVGAAHMALGWVTSEAVAVDGEGNPVDLTIRSFGVPRAAETPPIEVTIDPGRDAPVRGSDAVFVAVASAVWAHQGFPGEWPTGRRLR